MNKPGHGLLAAHRINVQVEQRCHLVGWLSRNNRTDGDDKECPKTIDIALSWKIAYSRKTLMIVMIIKAGWGRAAIP